MSPAVPSHAEVVALGARLPVGMSAKTVAAAIRARVSRVAEHPFLLDGAGDPLQCGRDPRIAQGAVGTERLLPMALAGLKQLVHGLPDRALQHGVPVLLALPEPRPGFSAADAHALIDRLATSPPITGAGLKVRLHGEGHAGMFAGLAQATALVAAGRSPLCIVGGVDSYLDADTLHWLDAQRRLLRTGTRAGFLPGEGAAMFALASPAARRQLGLPLLGRVRAVATAVEKRSLDSKEGLLGEGLSAAVRTATASLGPSEDIADLYGDINGERHRAEDWGFTLLRCPEHIEDGSRHVSAVGQCGDVGAATGGLQVILAVQAWRRGYARGPRALLFAGSWRGLRGAAVLEADRI